MKTTTKIFLGVMAFFGVLIGTIVFLVLFFQQAYPKLTWSSKFDPAKCTILGYNDISTDCKNEDKCKRFQTSIKVSVNKSGENDHWNADANKKNKFVFKSRDEASEWQNQYPLNTTTDCYYHKKDLQNVVFIRQSSKNADKEIATAVVLCVIISLAGPVIALIIYFVVKNNNNNLPRDPSREPESDKYSWVKIWKK